MENIIDFQPLYHTEDNVNINKKENINQNKIEISYNCLELKKIYHMCMKEKNDDFKECFEEYDKLIFCAFD
tara:strand:+ start:25 stop:237 length:213 start_codon:yes stop_codon:yes gene_type:complete